MPLPASLPASLPFTIEDLAVFEMALDNLHKSVSAPVNLMAPIVSARRKLTVVKAAMEAEAKAATEAAPQDGNGTATAEGG